MTADEAANGKTAPGGNEGYRPDIDGLRALAVLAVFAFHVKKSILPGGFTGVDMFFVISGYVVMGSLLRGCPAQSQPKTDVYALPLASDAGPVECSNSFERSKSSESSESSESTESSQEQASRCDFVGHASWFDCTPESVVAFYARRMKRLLPANLALVTIVGLLTCVVVPPWSENIRRYYKSGMFGLVGWANQFYASLETSYFDEGAATLELNPFTHMWSLGVEEQFYLAFPALMLAAYPRSGRAAVRLSMLLPKVVFGSSLACSAAMSSCLTCTSPQHAFYLLPSRLWELMAGVLLCELHVSFGAGVLVLAGVRQVALQVAAVFLVGYSLAFTRDDAGFPFPAAIPSVLGTLAFIDAGTSVSSPLNTTFSLSAVVYVGKLSYPIYLWHWPLLVLRRHLEMESVASLVLCVATTMACAVASHEILEGRARAWRPKKQWHVFAVMLPLVAACLAYLCLLRVHGGVVHRVVGRLFGAGDTLAIPQALPALPPPPPECRLANNHCGCHYKEPTFHLPPCAQTGGDAASLPPCHEYEDPPEGSHFSWGAFSGECSPGKSTVAHLDAERVKSLATGCLEPERGADGSARAMWLVGNSHASMIEPGLRLAAAAGGYDFHYFNTHAHCGLLENQAEYPECQNYKDTVGDVLLRYARPGDVLVYGKKRMDERREDVLAWWEPFNKQFTAKGARVLLLSDGPFMKASGTDCVPTFLKPDANKACEKSLAQVRKEQGASNEVYRELARQPGVFYFDYLPLLCNHTTCTAFVPGTGTLLIHDGHHLTLAGAKYLWPFWCSIFRSLDMGGAPDELELSVA